MRNILSKVNRNSSLIATNVAQASLPSPSESFVNQKAFILQSKVNDMKKIHYVHPKECSSMDIKISHDIYEVSKSMMSDNLSIDNPIEIINKANSLFKGRVAMITSFGLQSAVLLHMVTRLIPNIPVVWVDTGYLPKETYQYAEELKKVLDLNLIVATNKTWTPARMEAVYGKLWEYSDSESHKLYGTMRKLVPLESELKAIEPKPLAFFSGLRSSQTKLRSQMDIVGNQFGMYKIFPILKFSDRDIVDYIDKHDLPQHPLQSKGYLSVGDWHSSRPAKEGEGARITRFGGKFEECGLHVEDMGTNNSKNVKNQNQTSKDALIDKLLDQVDQKDLSIKVENDKSSTIVDQSIVEPKVLSNIKANNDKGLAVIMVKKKLAGGIICRKCQEVSKKLEEEKLENHIGYTTIYDATDPSSEGAVLAKYFNVPTAPFFLVRSLEEEEKNQPWQLIRSYLQLKKILQTQSRSKNNKTE